MQVASPEPFRHSARQLARQQTRPAPLQATLWGAGEVAATDITASWTQLDAESSILHQHHWISGADEALGQLVSGIAWGTAQRRPMYDRIVDVPRLNLMIDREAITLADPGTPLALIAVIANELEQLVGIGFDHVGINYYRDGRDSVAWHRDQIGPDRSSSVIALVSLGGPRGFRLRPHRGPAGTSAVPAQTRHDLTMHSGDLLVMAGACQRDWEHTVPKAASASQRISIVMRTKRTCEGPLFDR